MKKIFSIAIAVSFLAFAVNVLADEEVTAKDLYAAFAKNEIAAEAKYKGNIITVTGTVESIEKNIAGQPVVTLSAGFLQFVSCRFPESANNQLARLQKGDNVKFSCQVDQKIITSIHLSNCAF